MINELLRESSVAEEFIEEGMEKGLREGVRLVLTGRFAPLADDVLSAIERADHAALTDLLLHVGTETIEQLRARLGLSE